MLPVELCAKQLKLNQVHNILNGTAPVYLNTAFKLTTSQHNINTRSSTMSLQIPQVKSFGKNTFNYTGILAWNELPTEIKCLTRTFLCKKGVKLFLFDNLTFFLTWPYTFQVIYILLIIFNCVPVYLCTNLCMYKSTHVYIYDCFVFLFVTSIYLVRSQIITGIYSFEFCLVHHLPYTIIYL